MRSGFVRARSRDRQITPGARTRHEHDRRVRDHHVRDRPPARPQCLRRSSRTVPTTGRDLARSSTGSVHARLSRVCIAARRRALHDPPRLPSGDDLHGSLRSSPLWSTLPFLEDLGDLKHPSRWSRRLRAHPAQVLVHDAVLSNARRRLRLASACRAVSPGAAPSTFSSPCSSERARTAAHFSLWPALGQIRFRVAPLIPPTRVGGATNRAASLPTANPPSPDDGPQPDAAA